MVRNKKNKNAFSYNNHEVASRYFINESFNKTHSYHSNSSVKIHEHVFYWCFIEMV